MKSHHPVHYSLILAPVLVLSAVLSDSTKSWSRPAVTRGQAATYAAAKNGNLHVNEKAHSDRQDGRQEKWDKANPNQKAAAYNVTKSRSSQRPAGRANGTATNAQNVTARQATAVRAAQQNGTIRHR